MDLLIVTSDITAVAYNSNYTYINYRFVKRHLHGGPPEPVDVDSLKQEIQELRQRNQQLEEELAQLKTQVEYNLLMLVNVTSPSLSFSLLPAFKD